MANNLLTISMITNEALMVLENELTFTGQIDRNYDDQFAVVGAKIGNTVNVRRLVVSLVQLALRLMWKTLTRLPRQSFFDTQFHVDTQFTTQDLSLSLDMFSDRVLKPAIAAIANKIDFDGTTLATQSTANTVGTAGTVPSDILTFLTAQAYLDGEGAPRDGKRSCVLDPFTGASIIGSLKGLFNPNSVISQQYEKGLMGKDTIGMNWYMDQNTVAHTYGSYATATLATNTSTFTGSLTTGWASTSTITVAAATANATLNAGDTFTIAGVFAVNPQSRQPYGGNVLRSFVVTAPVTITGGGSASVTVSPAIITAGQFQNVTVLATSATAVVTPFNKTGEVSPQNLVFHRNAFTLASADLELPDGVHFAGRASDKDNGLSIRVVRQYTINNDSIPTRLDVLYGWAQLYPELACRVAA
jgi:hypothetical protein